MVSPGYFSVFGVKGADGCSPEELSKRARPEEMVMTDNLARYLISGKGSKEYTPRKGVEMVGKLVSFNKDGSDSVRVSAVCEIRSTMNTLRNKQRFIMSVMMDLNAPMPAFLIRTCLFA